MSKRQVRLSDIAELADVSVATASYVLNNKWRAQRIPETTAERIMKLAVAHNYVPDRNAVQLRHGSYQLIALISPHVGSLFAELLREIEEEAEKRDYQIITCSTFESLSREERYIRSMLARRIDGVIILPLDIRKEYLRDLMNSHVPTICFRDRDGYDFPAKFMSFDDFKGGQTATEHLIERGCKNIAFVYSPHFDEQEFLSHVPKARCRGYKAALKDADDSVAAPEVLRITPDMTNPSYVSDVLSFLKENAIDGVVGLSDIDCIHLMHACRAGGIDVPKDIKVVGFDDTDLARLSFPPLSCIRLPQSEVGLLMVEALFRMIGENVQETDDLLLAPSLVVRASSGGQ